LQVGALHAAAKRRPLLLLCSLFLFGSSLSVCFDILTLEFFLQASGKARVARAQTFTSVTSLPLIKGRLKKLFSNLQKPEKTLRFCSSLKVSPSTSGTWWMRTLLL
jgi:hypothetical protein